MKIITKRVLLPLTVLSFLIGCESKEDSQVYQDQAIVDITTANQIETPNNEDEIRKKVVIEKSSSSSNFQNNTGEDISLMDLSSDQEKLLDKSFAILTDESFGNEDKLRRIRALVEKFNHKYASTLVLKTITESNSEESTSNENDRDEKVTGWEEDLRKAQNFLNNQVFAKLNNICKKAQLAETDSSQSLVAISILKMYSIKALDHIHTSFLKYVAAPIQEKQKLGEDYLTNKLGEIYYGGEKILAESISKVQESLSDLSVNVEDVTNATLVDLHERGNKIKNQTLLSASRLMNDLSAEEIKAYEDAGNPITDEQIAAYKSKMLAERNQREAKKQKISNRIRVDKAHIGITTKNAVNKFFSGDYFVGLFTNKETDRISQMSDQELKEEMKRRMEENVNEIDSEELVRKLKEVNGEIRSLELNLTNYIKTNL